MSDLSEDVQLQKIVTELGVTERTAYRYINMLSEANIPIYYDRGAGRYRIVTPVKIDVDEFNLADQVTAQFALKQLSQELTSDHGVFLELLNRKISKNCTNSKEYLRTLSETNGMSVNNRYNLLLLIGAIDASRSIIVFHRTVRGATERKHLSEPTILGQSDWSVGDSYDSEISIPGSSVLRVTIL